MIFDATICRKTTQVRVVSDGVRPYILMRRMLASLLLVLFSFPLIAPALLANTVSGLPACCLRNGKHHCALADVDASPSLRANQPKCPLFPKAGAVPAFSKIVLFGAAPKTTAPYFFEATIATREGNLVPTVLRGSVPKRGPPTAP
jgi:hypothetical protein